MSELTRLVARSQDDDDNSVYPTELNILHEKLEDDQQS